MRKTEEKMHFKDNYSEKSLITMSKAGNTTAMDTLFRKYYERIYNFALFSLKNSSEAEDMTQEVFTEISGKIKTFKEKSAFFTWAYGIAKNKIRNYRKKIKAISMPEAEQSSTDYLPEKEYEEKERLDILYKAIDKLPPKQHWVIMLRLEELSFKKIAEITASTENTCKVNYFNAVKKLSTIIEK
ncbi:MAG: sigma-70 family RNA polymerase sigma factor [Actinomycetia bacterium]|nr:sigma-70 family RNA polymerase sigma factor [Actinomycetes bacterium]